MNGSNSQTIGLFPGWGSTFLVDGREDKKLHLLPGDVGSTFMFRQVTTLIAKGWVGARAGSI